MARGGGAAVGRERRTLSGSARSPIVEVTIEPLVRVVLLKDLSRAGDVTAMFSDPE